MAVDEVRPYTGMVEEVVPCIANGLDIKQEEGLAVTERSPGDLKEKVERRRRRLSTGVRERSRGTREPTVITKLFKDLGEFQKHDGKGRTKKNPPSTLAEGRIKKNPPMPEEGRIKKNPPNQYRVRQKVELRNMYKVLGKEDDRTVRFAALDQIMVFYRGRAARRPSEYYWRPSLLFRAELGELERETVWSGSDDINRNDGKLCESQIKTNKVVENKYKNKQFQRVKTSMSNNQTKSEDVSVTLSTTAAGDVSAEMTTTGGNESKLISGSEVPQESTSGQKIMAFRCEFDACGKVYKQKAGLKKHVMKVHSIAKVTSQEDFVPPKASTQKMAESSEEEGK